MLAATSQKIKNMSIVCAILVVMIHVKWPIDSVWMSTWWIDKLFHFGISRIAVPFFFVVSGYFLSQHFDEVGWWRKEVSKRVHSLVIPFVFWTLVAVISLYPLSLITNLIAHRPLGTSINLGGASLMRLLGLDLTVWPFLAPLWYVRCLFLFVLMSPLIKFALKHCPMIWLLTIFLLYFFSGQLFSVDVGRFFRRGFSLEGLFYFSAGCFIGRGHSYRLSRRASFSMGAIGLSLLALKVILSYNHLQIEGSVGKLMIPFLLYGVWWFCPEDKWPIWLTRCSFPIFLVHTITFNFLGRMMSHIPPIDNQVAAYIYFAIGVIVPIIFVACVKRVCPKLANFVFGGRL